MYKLVSQNKKLLDNMSYKSVLNRGYSVIKNSKNKIITSTSDLEKDERIVAKTSFAKIRAKVEGIETEGFKNQSRSPFASRTVSIKKSR